MSRTLRIALISEHASPLALLGGVDGGGQNVYVGHLARLLARQGHEVDVFTRRDRPDLPDAVAWGEGARIVHVPAGPARPVRKEDLLPFMGEFTSFVLDRCRRGGGYDLCHANFFMSALVAAEAKRALGVPFVVTFHALGRVRRRHQGGADTFPDGRIAIEGRAVREADRIIAECPQDEADLVELYEADPARIATIPCGFDPAEFWPVGRRRARAELGARPRRADRPPARPDGPPQGGRQRDPGGGQAPGSARDRRAAAGRRRRVGRARSRGHARDRPAVVDRPGRGDRRPREHSSAAGAAIGSAITTRRPTCSSPPRGTSHSASRRWRPPLAGPRSSARPSAGSRPPSSTARPASSCPLATPDALADRLACLFGDPGRIDRLGRRARLRANESFTWEKVAAAVAQGLRGGGRPARPGVGRGPERTPVVDRGRFSLPDDVPGGRTTMTGPCAVFLDKDGTLVDDVPCNVDPDLIRLAAGAERGLPALRDLGYRLFVVTNQAGVARGIFPESALVGVERRVRELLGDLGVDLDGFLYCPHDPAGRIEAYAIDCGCRKPAPGMLLGAGEAYGVDLGGPGSWATSSTTSRRVAGPGAGRC